MSSLDAREGHRFFERRFVVMCGKGGVGRSTLCAAVALEAARRGKRVLVCELNTKERIPSLFGARPRGPVISKVWPPRPTPGSPGAPRGPGEVWTVNVVPEHAMREYGLMKLRVRALYRVAFENRLVRGFLRLVPGLPELLMLGKAFFHETELDPDSGKPAWDMVVVDAPATGHGISLLRIPQVVLAITSTGPMADDARKMQALLVDPARTSVNIVTLPEAMPVSEALDLRRQLRDVLHLPAAYVFLNAVHAPDSEAPAPFAAAEELERLVASAASSAAILQPLADAARRRLYRDDLEREHIAVLAAGVDMPIVRLPFVSAPRWEIEAVTELSEHLSEGLLRWEAES